MGIFWKYFKVAKGLLARSLACGVHWESAWDWDSCSAGLANSLLCTLVTSCVHTNTSHLLCTPTRGLFRTLAQLHWSALQSPARSFSLECSPVCTVCPTSLCNSRHIAKCVRLHRCEATCSACVVHSVYLYLHFVSSACASVVCVANRPAVGLCPDMKAVNFRHDCFLPNPTSSTKNAKIIHPAHKMPECYISHKNSLNHTTSTHTKWISYIWYAKKPFATSSTKALPFRVGVLFFYCECAKATTLDRANTGTMAGLWFTHNSPPSMFWALSTELVNIYSAVHSCKIASVAHRGNTGDNCLECSLHPDWIFQPDFRFCGPYWSCLLLHWLVPGSTPGF